MYIVGLEWVMQVVSNSIPSSIPTDSDKKKWGTEQTRYFRFLLNVEI